MYAYAHKSIGKNKAARPVCVSESSNSAAQPGELKYTRLLVV